nr:MAG TPA: hypothetical protein [Caudoviricetes sp.]DAZ78779.1 MAG TPA: hypothetical protein [Caudoviricetes sp.]
MPIKYRLSRGEFLNELAKQVKRKKRGLLPS